MNWNISEAKNKLSEVLNHADKETQIIRRRQQDYVLMSGEHYRKITGKTPDFLDALINEGPRFDDLELPSRDHASMREIDL